MDSIPPKGYDQILLYQFKQGRKAGCFQMQFDQDHIALNWSAFATRPHYPIPTNNAIDNYTCIFFFNSGKVNAGRIFSLVVSKGISSLAQGDFFILS